VEAHCQRHAARSQGGLEIGDVLRHFLPRFLAAHPHFPARKKRLLERMALCHSGALGHTLRECSSCGFSESIPLCCGDRHCPSCQGGQAHRWRQKQTRWLLPVPYYHVVFTLPHEFHSLLLLNQARLYKLLFECAAATLLDFAKTRLGGTPGITAILHTWGQQLNYHPHLHCLLTAGALSEEGQSWRRPKQTRYLFPVAAVAALFKGKFLAGLRTLSAHLRWPKSFSPAALPPLYTKPWRVYFKRPFGGPEQTLRYLAHYTHRVAIANSRLKNIDPLKATVRFSYRDYADKSAIKSRELSGTEFIRRFSRHLLPRGFCKIRHFGLLSNNAKAQAIAQVRLILHSMATVKLLLALQRPAQPTAPHCPRCQKGRMQLVAVHTPWGIRIFRRPLPIDDTS
jgi:Putative transposase/Transposase zinc-binding domain